MTDTITPCPFCGHDDPQIDDISPGVWALSCPECGCVGPSLRDDQPASDPERAIELWNARHRARDAYDFLDQALNEGDGVYRP